jgi:uncharacterized protein YdiU (UPF0061 family)
MDIASPPAAAPGWPRSQRRFGAAGAPWLHPARPTPLPNPRWLAYNAALGASLGLDSRWRQEPQALAVLAGNVAWPGYAPVASAYGGHQFGRWVPQLGDGRVLLIAELTDAQGRRQELQLKGAGPTPLARGADGRAVWRSSLREYLACEALHALGVPSTRALSLVGTDDLRVERDGRFERAAVLARVAPSFVRFGHFEQLAQAGPPGALQALADQVIAEHFPHLAGLPDRHPRWLQEVITRHAALHAQWQTLGFCHGVLNTDNCSILGLTLDYGPFGFMDRFRILHVANASDSEGRYAWTAQPGVGQWNVARLLQACAPLLAPQPEAAAEQLAELQAQFAPQYQQAVMSGWRAKLGLRQAHEGDAALLNRLLSLMQQGRCDYTLTWRALAWVAEAGRSSTVAPDGGNRGGLALRDRFADPAAFDAWAADYHARLAAEGQTERADHRARAKRMRRTNPLFVLRNHLAQRAIADAEAGDLHSLQTLLRVLSRPYDAQPGMDLWARPPGAEEAALEVSCSA